MLHHFFNFCTVLAYRVNSRPGNSSVILADLKLDQEKVLDDVLSALFKEPKKWAVKGYNGMELANCRLFVLDFLGFLNTFHNLSDKDFCFVIQLFQVNLEDDKGLEQEISAALSKLKEKLVPNKKNS